MVTDGPPEPHRRRHAGRHRHASRWSVIRSGGPAAGPIIAFGAIGLIASAAIITAVVLSGGFVAGPVASNGSGGPSLGLPTASVASSATPTDTLPPISIVSPSLVPSEQPTGIIATRIVIARLGIDQRIVEGDGFDAPIGKAAHYPGTAWPGGGSNIYIYGHARVGMFLSLWQARVGDKVVLTLTNGTTRAYVVSKVLPRVPWDDVAYLNPTPTEQLTLQTSTSYYATAPRFVVIALPQS